MDIPHNKDGAKRRNSVRRNSARSRASDRPKLVSIKPERVDLPQEYEELAHISVYSLRQNLENLLACPSLLDIDKVKVQSDV